MKTALVPRGGQMLLVAVLLLAGLLSSTLVAVWAWTALTAGHVRRVRRVSLTVVPRLEELLAGVATGQGHVERGVARDGHRLVLVRADRGGESALDTSPARPGIAGAIGPEGGGAWMIVRAGTRATVRSDVAAGLGPDATGKAPGGREDASDRREAPRFEEAAAAWLARHEKAARRLRVRRATGANLEDRLTGWLVRAGVDASRAASVARDVRSGTGGESPR